MTIYLLKDYPEYAATSLADAQSLLTALGDPSDADNAATIDRVMGKLPPLVQSDTGEPLVISSIDDTAGTISSWVTDTSTTLAVGLGDGDPNGSFLYASTLSFSISGSTRVGTLALNTQQLLDAIWRRNPGARVGSPFGLQIRKTTSGVSETVGLLSVLVKLGVLAATPSTITSPTYPTTSEVIALLRRVDVRNFGAVGDGRTDDSAAILAADAAANGEVYFPAGTYRHDSTLTYRGNRWVGDGTSAAILDYRGASLALDLRAPDANHRKKISLSGIKLIGTNAQAGAIGVALAHNYRSTEAFSGVEIYDFPSWGLAFAGDNWILSFDNLSIISCGGGMTDSSALGSPSSPLAGFVFNNPVIENNGTSKSSGLGGGIHMLVAGGISAWKLNGGTIESNVGEAEILTTGGSFTASGVYLESESTLVNYVASLNGTNFSFLGGHILGDAGAVSGIRARGAAQGSIVDVVFSNITTHVVAEDTSSVRILGDGVVVSAASSAAAITLSSTGLAKKGNDWTNATLLNSWASAGSPYPAVGYYKDLEGFVHLRGGLNTGTVGTIAFNLPAGFRPASTLIFPTWTDTGLGMIVIESNGNFFPNAGGNGHFAINITFKAA